MAGLRRGGVLLTVFALFGTSEVDARDELAERRILEQHSWALADARSATGAQLQVYMPPHSERIVLRFYENGSLGASGCNEFGTGYALRDGRLVSPEGHLATQTVLGCVGARGAADEAAFLLLASNPRYQLTVSSNEVGPILTLEAESGDHVAFRGDARQ